ncbi:aconitate hydratase [Acetonema longum]|uniref:Aconitate hydratase n=1 Tax=Acetonema longum DSM 6540 TaxID=1009370 RepID=F7NGL5_9FIRM|nr:aconitate hydratase [Acetonema longum]EGO64819.1 aconitate hydratase [Acetonema longum DSM 6540]
MGFTIAEKIISAHLAKGSLKRGEPINVKIDQTLTHDVNGVMAYLEFEAMGIERVQTELSVSYIDHNLIQADFRNPDDHRYLLDVAAKHGIVVSRQGNGICHQVHLERFDIPGKTLLGSDSHTPAAGGIGMLGLGAGGLDVALAMAGEPFPLKMPQIVKVNLTGHLPPLVSAKNIVLELLRRVSVKGGVNKIFEYAGPGIKTLNVAERSIITNMGTETGATSSIFPSDEITQQWMRAQGREDQWIPLEADADAVYDAVIDINLAEIEPLIALPHQPDKVVPLREVEGLPVDQVVIGSCANSSLPDIARVADMLKGKAVHKNVDAGLYIGSRQVYLESVERGIFADILRAGVRVFESGCGACNGSGFAPPTNGVSLRTTTRNFLGRCGHATGNVYLVSPEVAVAAAMAGVITDPRELGITPGEFKMPDQFLIEDNMFIYPPANGADISIRRGPNISALPELAAAPDIISGKTLIKLGEDITTDHITPAGANFLPLRNNTPEISKYTFHFVDTSFAERAKAEGGGIIVAGVNYGQGSSREQAALAPRYLGVSAIIAKSFARIHLANLVNFGILPLVFENESDYSSIEQGDQLKLEFKPLFESQATAVVNETKQLEFAVKTPLTHEELEIVKSGGRLNWIKSGG